METPRDAPAAPDALVARIDAILQELLELRRQVTLHEHGSQENLTSELFGTLGHGTWAEYDLSLDWQRLGS